MTSNLVAGVLALRKSREMLACILVGAFVLSLALSGQTRDFENSFRNFLFSFGNPEASGQLHVVEMDAASVAAIQQWPWPREHYANVIEALDNAGVASITFDVDFSSSSNPSGDARLAEAIAASSVRVTLPTFSQAAGSASNRTLDALPIASLRENAALGAVSVSPDADGFVRDMLLGTVTAGVPRPSLSALIAQRGGEADKQFPINFGIDIRSIPRHSFDMVEQRRFDPDVFRGKDILIGATAVEMGDRYVVPRYGVVPGVLIQALAAETLYRGKPIWAGWKLPLVLAFLCSIWLVRCRTYSKVVRDWAVAIGVTTTTAIVSWSNAQILWEIIPAASMLTFSASIGVARNVIAGIQQRRRHDPSTGLPNKLSLQSVSHTPPHNFTIAAFITNYDSISAVVGDEGAITLVQRIAERLRIGGGTEVVYRLEDRVLAWACHGQEYEIDEMLTGLAAIMRSPIEISGRKIDAALAFGVAAPACINEAIFAADQAGRKGELWEYHIAAERAALEQQVSLMGELDTAIERRELEVAYQPKLELSIDRITSVEALVRWNHPERGYLRPDTFVPLAEKTDRIDDLTLFVLAQTIEDLKNWCAQGLVMKAAVNISARLVTSPSFIAAAEALLKGTTVPRNRLIFEVTESSAIADPVVAAKALGNLRAMGVSISMDDYGTGQSTLSYLKQLPLSELKIDRSFVQYAHVNQNDGVLVRSTVELAHELGLSVVAEGVEDPECLAYLRQINCDFAQGYLIGKPMRAEQIVEACGEFCPLAA